MPRIVETIVTTTGPGGTPHIAPLGLIKDGEHWKVQEGLNMLRPCGFWLLVPAATCSPWQHRRCSWVAYFRYIGVNDLRSFIFIYIFDSKHTSYETGCEL